MTPTRTFEALVQFTNTEFDKLQETVTRAIEDARKDAGNADAFDVTLGLANRLSFYALKMAASLHNQSLESSRVREPSQLMLPFPPN